MRSPYLDPVAPRHRAPPILPRVGGFFFWLIVLVATPAVADECAELRNHIDIETALAGPKFGDRDGLFAAFNAAMSATSADPRALPAAFAAHRALAEATRLIRSDVSDENVAMFHRALLAAYEVAYLANCVLGERSSRS